MASLAEGITGLEGNFGATTTLLVSGSTGAATEGREVRSAQVVAATVKATRAGNRRMIDSQ